MENHSASPTLIDIRNTPYLSNNELPPDEIVSAAKDAIHIYQSNLCDKVRVINMLYIIVAKLQQEICSIKDEIQWCTPLIAPIRRLPDELLGEIFLRCIPADRNPRTLVSEAPLLLTTVCRKWREISVSTKQLWAKIHIHCIDRVTPHIELVFKNSPQPNWPAIIVGIEQWFLRSGNYPLSVSIFCISWVNKEYIGWDSTDGYVLTHLAPLMARGAYHWESIEYAGPRDLFSRILESVATLVDLESSNIPFTLLHTVRVKYEAYHGWGDGFDLTKLSQGILLTPTLRKLSIEGDGNLLDVYWTSLTHLSIHDAIHRDIALNILKQCNALEGCSFNIIPATSDGMHPTSYIPYPTTLRATETEQHRTRLLPHLKTLFITGEKDNEENVCGHIYAPALNHFLYCPTYRPETVTYLSTADGSAYILTETDFPRPLSSPLCNFLQQCPSLDVLTLNPCNIPANDVLAILQSTPQITSLILNQTGRSGTPGNDPSPLPSLFQAPLRPLFEQQLISSVTGLSTHIPGRLVANLKSFSALGIPVNQVSLTSMLVEFINSRIYPLRDRSDSGPVTNSQDEPAAPWLATLERITLTLSDAPVEIDTLISEHAESVGRRVGEDLIVDISYPWSEEIQLVKKDKGLMELGGVPFVWDDTAITE